MAFELEQNFGTNGIVGNDNYISVIRSTHIQNGKILSAGYYYNEIDEEYYLFMVRYNSTGTIDTTFGTNGYILTDYQVNGSEFSKIMFVLSNNKFIVVCKDPSGNNFVFIRYTENGLIDTSFDTDGFLNTGYTFNQGLFCSIINDGNDGIIFSYVNSGLKYRRYNSNGTTNGNLTSTIFDFSDRWCLCNTVDSNGNIIFAGRESGGGGIVSNPLLYVVYDTSDALVTTIGTAGYVYYTHDVVSNQGYSSVITDADDNIILVAYYGVSTVLVHKYDTNGTLLYYNRDISAKGDYTSLNILSGKILVGARKDNNSDTKFESFYLTRLNSNLTVDTSFGTNGYIITPVTTGIFESRMLNIVIYSSSKIIVSGYIFDTVNVTDNDGDITKFRILSFSSENQDPVFADLLNTITTNENLLEFNVENFGTNNETVSIIMGEIIDEMLKKKYF